MLDDDLVQVRRHAPAEVRVESLEAAADPRHHRHDGQQPPGALPPGLLAAALGGRSLLGGGVKGGEVRGRVKNERVVRKICALINNALAPPARSIPYGPHLEVWREALDVLSGILVWEEKCDVGRSQRLQRREGLQLAVLRRGWEKTEE